MADQTGQHLPGVQHTPRHRSAQCDPDFHLDQVQISRTALAPDVVSLAISGEIDATTMAEWQNALAAALALPQLRLLICDCTELRFLSISGFLALVDAHHTARGRGVEIRLVHPPRALIRLLDSIRQAPTLSTDTYLVSAAVALAVQQEEPNRNDGRRNTTMSTNDEVDQTTGEVKEVVGKALGDKELEAEGHTQHGVARAKKAVRDAADKVADAARKALGRDE